MPLTDKDALEFAKFVGVDDAENLDEAKTKHQATYLTEDQIHASKELIGKFTGKTMASVRHQMIKEAREDFGDEFNATDLQKMPIEQAFNTVRKMYLSREEKTRTELEAKVGQSNDQAVKDLQDKYLKLEGKYKEVEGLKTNIASEYETFKSTAQKEKQDILVKYHKNELFGKFAPRFDKAMPPLAIKGFYAEAESELKFLTDENGNPYMADANGKRFPSKKKAGEFMSDEEAFEAFAESKGVLQKNHQGGQPAFRVPGQQAPAPGFPPAPPPENTPGKKSKVSQRAWS